MRIAARSNIVAIGCGSAYPRTTAPRCPRSWLLELRKRDPSVGSLCRAKSGGTTAGRWELRVNLKYWLRRAAVGNCHPAPSPADAALASSSRPAPCRTRARVHAAAALTGAARRGARCCGCSVRTCGARIPPRRAHHIAAPYRTSPAPARAPTAKKP
eukprot:scaffold241_cov229-Prasinococcus_capsulatus_cf.AAC.5